MIIKQNRVPTFPLVLHIEWREHLQLLSDEKLITCLRKSYSIEHNNNNITIKNNNNNNNNNNDDDDDDDDDEIN